MGVKLCPHCNECNKSNAILCKGCGSSITQVNVIGATLKDTFTSPVTPQVIFQNYDDTNCPSCNEKLTNNSRNCKNCGTFISRVHQRGNIKLYKSKKNGGVREYILAALIAMILIFASPIIFNTSSFHKLNKTFFLFNLFIIGVVQIVSPETSWYLSEGWKYKNAEPSDLYLELAKFGGILFCIISIAYFFLG